MRSLFLAAIAAVLVQPLVMVLQTALLFAISLSNGAKWAPGDERLFWQLVPVSVYVLIVATIFVLVLGIPIFILLRRLNRLNWRSVTAAGFGAAAVPIGLMGWPLWQGSRTIPPVQIGTATMWIL